MTSGRSGFQWLQWVRSVEFVEHQSQGPTTLSQSEEDLWLKLLMNEEWSQNDLLRLHTDLSIAMYLLIGPLEDLDNQSLRCSCGHQFQRVPVVFDWGTARLKNISKPWGTMPYPRRASNLCSQRRRFSDVSPWSKQLAEAAGVSGISS